MNSGCSVVMVSYQTGPVLFAGIKTVLKQKPLAELIVVDNGNPPAALTRLQQMALTEPRLVIISGQGNVGFAKGCNLGVKKARGEYVLLLNPDCLLPPDALETMMTEFKKIPETMVAGCRLENPDGSEQRGGRRQLLTPLTGLIEALGLHGLLRLKSFNLNRTPMPEETFEVPAISGAFMFMKRKDYNHLHGFDEGFFLHVEDLDFCMRVHKTGGSVVYVPGVRVTHLGGSDGKAISRFIEWHKAKGFRRYFDKHFRGKYLPGFLTIVHAAILTRFAFRVTVGELENRLWRTPTLAQTLATKRLLFLASGLAELAESQELEGKTVLVTGATGQTGLCIIRRLLAAGASVLALSRGNAISFSHERLRWIKGDLTDRTLRFDGCVADAIVHCAPLWYLPPAMNALAATEASRIIALGSTSVFAKATSKNDYDKELVRNLSLSETELFQRCEAAGVAITILRPTLIYGVGLDENITVLARFIRRFGFFPVHPPAFGRRQPVHADDLAIGVMHALDNKKTYGKAYNVSGGEIITYRDMLDRLFRLLGKKPRIVETTMLPSIFDITGLLLRRKHINGEIARRMNDDLIFFHDEAAHDFAFSPRPFLSGGIRDVEGF